MSVLTKFAESERKDADLVAAPAEDGIDFGRKELWIAAGDIHIYILTLIKAIDNPFESIDLLNFVQEDVVILSLRGNSGI